MYILLSLMPLVATTLVVADGGAAAAVPMSLPISVSLSRMSRPRLGDVKGIRYNSKKRADEGTSFRTKKGIRPRRLLLLLLIPEHGLRYIDRRSVCSNSKRKSGRRHFYSKNNENGIGLSTGLLLCFIIIPEHGIVFSEKKK